jgi:hypothetical protein
MSGLENEYMTNSNNLTHIYINGYLPAKARSIASELLGGFGP